MMLHGVLDKIMPSPIASYLHGLALQNSNGVFCG